MPGSAGPMVRIFVKGITRVRICGEMDFAKCAVVNDF